MAVISNNTFDPLKRYVGVRLQQGVPIVDADWNELEDVRRFELRAYLKWFVGDGVPDGSDGFRVLGTGATNDFAISAGPTASGPALTDPVERGLRQVGRFIVDGLDVLLPADTSYQNQDLHVSKGTAAIAAAAKLGMPVIADIPVLNGNVLVYLDVWERLVTPSEDTGLVFAGLGTESCARTKREWAVRVRTLHDVPKPGDGTTDWSAGHSYAAIARIMRRAGSGVVNASDVTDLRSTRLLLPPATLVEDVFGGTVGDYRQGLNRPAMSLRDAFNAVARGEVPALPEHPLTATLVGSTQAPCGATLDGTGGLLLAWVDGSALVQVYVGRLDLANPSAGFAATQITSGTNNHTAPRLVTLPNGDLLLAYWATVGTASDIYYRRGGTAAALLGATEQKLTTSASVVGKATYPFVVVSNNIVVFFYFVTNQYFFQRWDAAASALIDAAPVPLTDANAGELHATVDTSGTVWIVFTTTTGGSGIRLVKMTPTGTSATVTAAFIPAAASTGDTYHNPFVATSGGVTLALWDGNSGIQFASVGLPLIGTSGQLPYTLPGDNHPLATFDTAGKRMVVAYSRPVPPSKIANDIVISFGDPESGGWLPPVIASVTASEDMLASRPYMGGLFPARGSLWMVWLRRDPGTGGRRSFYRQICNPL